MIARSFKHIVCIFNLLSGARAAAESFFDLVREPIRQGTGIDIGHAPGGRKPHGLQPGFDLQHFRALAGWSNSTKLTLWAATYHHVPDVALDYLFEHIPEAATVLSFEMPPWLEQACIARQVDYIDLRHSPLRFGRDLYIALRTSHRDVQARIAAREVTEEELRLEAALLAANVRAHRGRLEEAARYHFNLDQSLIFVSQHPDDPALLSADGCRLNCLDFAEQLRELAEGRRILHLAAMDAEEFAIEERTTLAEILGKPVRPCVQSAYQILSAHDDLILTGISAPVLQEAAWFDKPAHHLGPVFVPLAMAPEHAAPGFAQVDFQALLAPAFWHETLTPEAPPPKLSRLPSISRHHGRETLDAWWEYEKLLTWERLLPYRAFERMGGELLRRRVSALEATLHPKQPATSDAPADEERWPVSRTAIKQLKNSKQGQTAYILGNAPSLNELDIDQLMARESFWCNRAYKLEEQGYIFRPKYYFIADPLTIQEIPDEIMGIKAGIKFFRHEVYRLAAKSHPDELKQQHIISFKSDQTPAPGTAMCDDENNFSYDPDIHIYQGWTVVLDAVQFAFYMGYSRVYVGGVDLDYSGQTHFFGGSFRDLAPMDELTDRIRRAFLVARHHFERKGRVLAKITPSPNLPLAFIDDETVRRKPK